MAVLNKENLEELNEYNNFVRNRVGTSFMQDLNWGIVKNTWKQEAVYLKENDKIIAAMMILIQSVPHTNVSMAYSPRGPLCDINDIELVKKLVNEAEPIMKKYNCYVLKFDPQCVYTEELNQLYINNGFKTTGLNSNENEVIQPIYEAILKLNGKNEEELMNEFSRTTRYNIRFSNKKGVKVSYSRNADDLKTFFELYKITAERNKIGHRNFDYFERMLQAYDENHLRIYISEHEGDKLSAAIATNFGGELYYAYGASSNEKRNLNPNYALQMEMIRWALETKCDTYNFGGILTLEPNNGLYRFKVGFCKDEGIYRNIGEINKVYKPFYYFLLSKVYPLIKGIQKKSRRKKTN